MPEIANTNQWYILENVDYDNLTFDILNCHVIKIRAIFVNWQYDFEMVANIVSDTGYNTCGAFSTVWIYDKLYCVTFRFKKSERRIYACFSELPNTAGYIG